MPAGRPTDYRPEYIEQAEKLCLLGCTTSPEMVALVNDGFFVDSFIESLKRNADKNLARRKKRALRRIPNASQKLANATRARMWAALKGKSTGKLLSRLPYSVLTLKNHLEAMFSPGMSWSNYGSWHIDHRKPCAAFDLRDESQFQQCWSLDNLQPLWASENIRKGKKYAST